MATPAPAFEVTLRVFLREEICGISCALVTREASFQEHGAIIYIHGRSHFSDLARMRGDQGVWVILWSIYLVGVKDVIPILHMEMGGLNPRSVPRVEAFVHSVLVTQGRKT